VSTSTLPKARPPSEIRRARNLRRVGMAILVLFVLTGALGFFGTRTATATGAGGGYVVEVTYPKVSRPGHAVKYQVQVTRRGGFAGPIHMRFSSDYFDMFDENSFTPDPDSTTATAAYDIYAFEPPPGDSFVVASDTRVEPARQRGEKGEVSVLDDSGRPVVTVHYRTRIFP